MRARSFAAVTTSNDRTRRQSDGYAPAVGFGTTAYRADLAGRAQPFGEHDSEWLAIAVLLEQAARLGAADGFAMLEQARRLAADVVSAAALETLVRREWQNADVHPVDPIVAVAQETYDRNAFRTAAHILDALLATDRSLSDLQRGRLLARRARARRSGWGGQSLCARLAHGSRAARSRTHGARLVWTRCRRTISRQLPRGPALRAADGADRRSAWIALAVARRAQQPDGVRRHRRPDRRRARAWLDCLSGRRSAGAGSRGARQRLAGPVRLRPRAGSSRRVGGGRGN